MKAKELRDMSEDQLAAMLKDARDAVFRLRVQAKMERLDSPSELKKNKKAVARILTVIGQRKAAR
ncbi:MAG: 50S ribosomal protein L29 [Thermoguttaceae bacterium]